MRCVSAAFVCFDRACVVEALASLVQTSFLLVPVRLGLESSSPVVGPSVPLFERPAPVGRLRTIAKNCAQNKRETTWKKREENFINHQNELLKTNKIQAQEILKLEGDLLTNEKIHTEEISRVQGELSGLKSDQDGFKDKIAALRSVARALESENQLLAGEKENLQNFKTQFCKDNGALK